MGPVDEKDVPARVVGYDTIINDATYFIASTLSKGNGLKRIVVLGGIGREMARIAGGVGLKVLAYNRSPKPGTVPIDEVLAKSDIVSLQLGLNDHTRGFLDRQRLGKTKLGVIIVNTARAGVVDEPALIERLRSGHVGHYATDVFGKEPPSADEPLLKLDNVTLTAHAGYNTPEAAMTMYRRAIDLAAAR